MKLMFGAFVDENEIVRICKHISKVFKGIVGKRGGNLLGRFCCLSIQIRFSRVFHMSVNPVIFTRRAKNTELKKIGFLNFLNNYRKKKGNRNPMAELQIELKLSLQIPENGLSITNLLYQLRKFTAWLFFAILEATFSAVEQRAIEGLKATFPGRYLRNGLRRKPQQIRTAYGLFGYRAGRVLDKETKKTFSPLWQAIGVPAYRRTMEESTEGGMGLVCHLSYREGGDALGVGFCRGEAQVWSGGDLD
jgi:hypothetical protein